MCRILIAEDELIGRMVLKKTLQKRFNECEIIDVESGRAAMEVFHSMPIHIAILNIEMTGMQGLEVAEHMRRENKEIKIIFLSVSEKFEYAKRAVSLRAMEYFLKPYSEREMLRIVEEAVEDYEGKEKNPTESFVWGNDTAHTPESINRLSMMVTMIEEYIRNNYKQDISMQDAARAINYSETYFCKIFKQKYGQSFTSYLTGYRMEEAKKLLLQPTVNVRKVGETVGYADATYFARVFRRSTGMSPSEYRNAFFQSIK